MYQISIFIMVRLILIMVRSIRTIVSPVIYTLAKVTSRLFTKAIKGISRGFKDRPFFMIAMLGSPVFVMTIAIVR